MNLLCIGYLLQVMTYKSGSYTQKDSTGEKKTLIFFICKQLLINDTF